MNGMPNNVDPMEIRLEHGRDTGPKLGLHGQYLGDGLPECNALGPRAFLRKGAHYVCE